MSMFVLGVLFSVALVLAFAIGRGGRRGRRRSRRILAGQWLSRRLDLTGEQEPVVQEAIDSLFDAMTELGQRARSTHEGIVHGIGLEAIDEEALQASFDEQAALVRAAQEVVRDNLAKVHGVLKPWQRQSLRDLMQQRRRRHRRILACA